LCVGRLASTLKHRAFVCSLRVQSHDRGLKKNSKSCKALAKTSPLSRFSSHFAASTGVSTAWLRPHCQQSPLSQLSCLVAAILHIDVAATSRARTTNGTRHANILRDGATVRGEGRMRTKDDPYDLLFKHSYYIGSHRAGDRPRSSSERTTPASPLAPAHVPVRGGRPARRRSSTGLGKVLS
jgi:hypothetical protein